MKILVDTSVFIDYTRAGKGALSHILETKKKTKNDLYVPTIVIAELWAGSSMDDSKEEELVKRLISGFRKVSLSVEIAKKSGKLLREKSVLGAFDAIIAASALHVDAQLATNNVKHFKKVKGLRLFGED